MPEEPVFQVLTYPEDAWEAAVKKPESSVQKVFVWLFIRKRRSFYEISDFCADQRTSRRKNHGYAGKHRDHLPGNAGQILQKTDFCQRGAEAEILSGKGPDVPTYVEYGAADIGIVGKDTILEEGRKLYEVMDLGFGACRMCVCGRKRRANTFREIS